MYQQLSMAISWIFNSTNWTLQKTFVKEIETSRRWWKARRTFFGNSFQVSVGFWHRWWRLSLFLQSTRHSVTQQLILNMPGSVWWMYCDLWLSLTSDSNMNTFSKAFCSFFRTLWSCSWRCWFSWFTSSRSLADRWIWGWPKKILSLTEWMN